MNALAPQVPLNLPVKLLPILKPKRFKILYGGRGGGKSHNVAQALLMLGLQSKLRILCVRQIQKSLAESSMQVLTDYIVKLGLSAYYRVMRDEIRGYNGTTFDFAGLQDHTADSIKSWEGADIIWCEEARSITEYSWNILIPTIRKPGSEIWATFNPEDESDYVYARFVAGHDPDALVIEVNWPDNPWFTEEMDTERRKLQALNADLYQHVWEGKCRSVTGTIFKREWFRYYDRPPGRLNRYAASDWAFTEDGGDWTEHGVFGLDPQGDIYILDWWSGQTDPSVWIQAWLSLMVKHLPRVAFEEAGKDRRAMDSAINKAMREHEPRVFVQREALPTVGNKVERAVAFAVRCASGAVYLPKNKPWAERLVNQLCAFTGQDGKVDDMVDVCGLIGRGLDSMVNAPVPASDRKPEVKPFTEKWLIANEAKEKPRARFT